MAAVPNFFVVGAPKAGTTSLHRYLSQHPAIFMSPIKEPCFFAPEVVDFTPESRQAFEADRTALRAYLDGPILPPRGHGIVLDWSDYLKLFAQARDEKAIGEVSGNYLASAGAAAAIRNRLPDARIVMVLRDPVDRLHSQYAGAQASGLTSASFVDWTMAQLDLEAARNPTFGPVWTGRYAQHLNRYLDVFPREQISIHFYDDYSKDAPSTLRAIFAFLDVDPRHRIDTSRRHNVSVVPRYERVHALLGRAGRRALAGLIPRDWRDGLRKRYLKPAGRPSAEERRRILPIYEDDIRELADRLERDLSGWLNVGPS